MECRRLDARVKGRAWRTIGSFKEVSSQATRGICRLRSGVNFLRGAHRASKLDRLPRNFGDHMFERSQYSHRVQIIVVANVSDAEKLPFQLRISIGHDRAKQRAGATLGRSRCD